MATMVYNIKLDNVTLLTTAVISVVEEERSITITEVLLGRKNIIRLLSKKAIKRLEKKIKKVLC
jgi:hypothetical protein